MELYSSAFGNHPTPGSVLRPGPMILRRNKLAAGSQPVRVAGSRPQGPVGQVSRGLGARAPRAWGPARQGPGPSPQKPTHTAFWGCKGERKRVFTLSAFGNHPTRPPRSADSPPRGGSSSSQVYITPLKNRKPHINTVLPTIACGRNR